MAVDKNGKQLPAGITYRPKEGRYMARFSYAGKRYMLYDRDNPKRLEKAMNDMRYELEHGLKGNVDKIILNKWFDIWAAEYKANVVKESTLILYKQYYGWYIKPILGAVQVRNIRSIHVQKIINSMVDRGFAENTMKKVSAILSDVLTYAVNNDILVRNPCQGVSIPQKEPKKRRVLTRDEQAVFLRTAKESPYYPLYVTALYTGMRIGELLALTWDDVDFKKSSISVNKTLSYIQSKKGQKGEIKLQTPKTKAGERTIPILAELSKVLRRHKLEQRTLRLELGDKWNGEHGLGDLVFTTQFGTPLSERYVNKSMEYISNRINKAEAKAAEKEKRKAVVFEKISPHGLRHTFATRAFENGMKDKAVQEIMGHGSLSMTMDLYTHVTNDTKEEEMKKLSKAFQA